MSDSHWQRPRTGKRWIAIGAGLLLAGSAIAIFIRNNAEFWQQQTDGSFRMSPAARTRDPGTPRSSSGHYFRLGSRRSGAALVPESNQSAGELPDSVASISLERIRGITADRPDIELLVDCVIYFAPESSRDIMLARREDIRVLVRNCMSRYNTAEMRLPEIQRHVEKELSVVFNGIQIARVELHGNTIEQTGKK